MVSRGKPTATSVFGSSRRESHDSTAFYSRFTPPFVSRDETVNLATDLGDGCLLGDSRDMHQIPDSSVALVVTSPPYFVGKEYEIAVTAEKNLDELTSSKSLKEPFNRTISRLYELTSPNFNL